jgi:hypothetical protein
MKDGRLERSGDYYSPTTATCEHCAFARTFRATGKSPIPHYDTARNSLRGHIKREHNVSLPEIRESGEDS